MNAPGGDSGDRSQARPVGGWFHPRAWLLWLGSGAAAALQTQNPYYLTIVLLSALFVRARLGDGAPRPSLLRVAWAIPLVTALINAIAVRLGETVLFRIPAALPLLGGPVTLEALLFGFLTGYSLLVLLTLFATFGAVADYHALLRLAPGFLFQAALVTNIALTFVPQTGRALEEIRQAQRIRGHQFRGWRDLPPLILPLLTMGLERSIALAEAMESRGFGGVERGHGWAGQRALWLRLLLLGGLSLLAGSVAWLLTGAGRLWPVTGALLGLAAVAVALRAMSRRLQRSRFRPLRWRRRDSVLAGSALLLLAGLLLLGRLDAPSLFFYPYPRITAPPFDPVVAAGLALLALPPFLIPGTAPVEPENHMEATWAG